MPSTPQEVMAAVRASLEAWVEVVRASDLDPLDQGAVRHWLKNEHGIPENSQWAIADAAARDTGWERPSEEGYVDGQYAGPRAHLRPIFARLLPVAYEQNGVTHWRDRCDDLILPAASSFRPGRFFMPAHRSWIPALPLLLAACTSPAADDPPGTERVQVGDTTVVRIAGEGVWGDTARLVEEVRFGVLEGAPEYQFGFITDMAVDAEEGVYVFDQNVPIIRYYDASGTYLRDVGGEGEGPGEYLDASLGLTVRTDGRLVMRDPRNMRLNVYEADGSHSDSWRLGSGLFTSQATVRDTADHLFMKILTGRPERNEAWPIALVHVDERGEIVDTIVPPTLSDEPSGPSGNFTPSKLWAYSPLGGFVAGVNDRYAIHHFRPDGTVLRIEREVQPVAVHPTERAEYEAAGDWMRANQGQFMTSDIPPVPNVKPLYRTLWVGEEGRIWVRRYAQARQDSSRIPDEPDPARPPPITWVEPQLFDVFEPDGTFLGTVRVPPRTSLSVIRGDRAWGIHRGEFNESYVVRFRIEPGQGGL